jgi:hypothetical protein
VVQTANPGFLLPPQNLDCNCYYPQETAYWSCAYAELHKASAYGGVGGMLMEAFFYTVVLMMRLEKSFGTLVRGL